MDQDSAERTAGSREDTNLDLSFLVRQCGGHAERLSPGERVGLTCDGDKGSRERNRVSPRTATTAIVCLRTDGIVRQPLCKKTAIRTQKIEASSAGPWGLGSTVR